MRKMPSRMYCHFRNFEVKFEVKVCKNDGIFYLSYYKCKESVDTCYKESYFYNYSKETDTAFFIIAKTEGYSL